jgi:hypothetical protein
MRHVIKAKTKTMNGSVDSRSSSFVDVYLVFVHTLSTCLPTLAIDDDSLLSHDFEPSRCNVPLFDSNTFKSLALFARLCMSEMAEVRS